MEFRVLWSLKNWFIGVYFNLGFDYFTYHLTLCLILIFNRVSKNFNIFAIRKEIAPFCREKTENEKANKK